MRLVVMVVAGLVVAGCTGPGWDHTFAFLDAPKPPPPPAAAPALPTADWCRQAAAAAKSEAAEQGFDTATQARRAETIYTQCLRTR